jgi:hypothetical protein
MQVFIHIPNVALFNLVVKRNHRFCTLTVWGRTLIHRGYKR